MRNEEATAIVQRALGTDDPVGPVEERGGQVVVTASGSRWAVLPFDGPEDLGRRAELFHVVPHVAADPGPRPRGVARLTDGALLALDDPEQVRELWALVGSELEPATLAWLLSFYQPGAPRAVPHQRLIADRFVLGSLLTDRQLAAVGALVGVAASSPGSDRLVVEFCTFSLQGQAHRPRVTLHRWHVGAGPGPRDLVWASRTIAEGLEPVTDAR